ncbi:glycosyltransferase family 4 protein [Luteimonas sp. MC1825]|uniref:glycosyltransferase family 4 protein n=1 Tax=Luteimonas sp. MC1825 TaxID=2761107 RepID=UPI0016230304|nr:glycosyltransferase family 4 protein [Luteimonas sp. MC1825]MBB6599050.1 glycosyltransferase family 4 protein [Luteimonas sp. MC1825]QOC89183.1 glycosyltransferase family 4 protein [Luteimonas sp. MC1825]
MGLSLYGPLAASTRYRLQQYVPGLRDHGIELDVHGLLDDRYLRRRFAGERLPLGSMVASGLSRLRQLLRQRDYDGAVVYCELFPFMPGALEQSLIKIPYVCDFDDAFYLKYRSGARSLMPGLGRKFDGLVAAATRVTAGSRVLAEYAGQLNPATTLLPTVVDTDRYQRRDVMRAPGFTVGWIGSPSTAPYLQALVGPLETLGREGVVRLVVIGGKAPRIDGIEIVELPWSEDTEVDLINGFDVGVMPLPDTAWSRGKCAFKLIQYMACGVPVVASPVGANRDVVTADCGVLADNEAAWIDALRLLRDDNQLRERLGAHGRARVVDGYSLSRNLPVFGAAISALSRGSN